MQLIKSIENKIDLKPLRFKIELFLFPLLLLIMIYLLFFNKEVKNFANEEIKIEVNSLKMKVEIIDIIKDIETFIAKEEIYLEKISNDSKSIDIEVLASLKKRLKLFNYLENYNNYSKIESFDLKDESLKISILFDKFYKKELIDISDDLNSLEDKKQLFLTLKAIVNKKVLINENWFEKDDFIDKLQISYIGSNSVILENKIRRVELRLYKNE